MERSSLLRPIVILANKMDKYKGKTSLSKLILEGKTYGIKDVCDVPSDMLLNKSCESKNHSLNYNGF